MFLQKKKQYDIDLQRFLESLPEEERDRVMTEEKLGGARLGGGVASSPHRAKSPSVKERSREAEPDSWVSTNPKERRDGKKTAKLPETPKTAEEMWQHSVIGDYLAKYRSDRRKAQAGMEAAWKSMEKKEKIPWIKKAAEDQKRYERELLEMRTPAPGQAQRKPKFDGEPKKPPVSGYQMFSQELLTNGELNHFSLKERMVEIGKRWHKLSQSQKDKYKKQVEEQQTEYKAELEAWVKSLSPQDRAVYKEFSSSKRRSTAKVRSSPGAKVRVTAKGKAASSRAATQAVGVAKRAMAYRAKQDMSDSDEEEEKSDSSDSDEDDETSGSTDSEDDDDDDEENDDEDDDDDEDQSSSEESSDSDSD